jgi:hypothetical protein
MAERDHEMADDLNMIWRHTDTICMPNNKERNTKKQYTLPLDVRKLTCTISVTSQNIYGRPWSS